MPLIEPVPTDFIDADVLATLRRAEEEGRLASLRYPRLLAYSRALVRASSRAYATEGDHLISSRLRELIRLRSAQLGGCAECQAARYDESVDDATATCLMIDNGALDESEAIVMRFVTLMHTDHHAIDAEMYRQLARHFSTAQIVEIGVWTGQTLGSHRFIHTLDLLNDDPAILPFDPAQIDATEAAAASEAT